MVHFFRNSGVYAGLASALCFLVLFSLLSPMPAEPQRDCDFTISLEMPPPKSAGGNVFYTEVRGGMVHGKLYVHSWYYVAGGKASVKHTGLGFDCPYEMPWGFEHDGLVGTAWMFVSLRCTECGRESRACIERPIISKGVGGE